MELMEVITVNQQPTKVTRSKDEWDKWYVRRGFTRADMDMLVMDFLVNKEHHIVAETFHLESGCALGIEDLQVLETQKLIRNLIINRRYDEAIDHIHGKVDMDFFAERKRLHFHLEQQKMIEMCRKRDFAAALAFSRYFVRWEKVYKHITDEDDFTDEVRQTLLLMTYGDDPHSPAAELLDRRRGFVLAKSILEEIIISQGREPGNFIEKAIKMLEHKQEELKKQINFPEFNFISGHAELWT